MDNISDEIKKDIDNKRDVFMNAILGSVLGGGLFVGMGVASSFLVASTFFLVVAGLAGMCWGVDYISKKLYPYPNLNRLYGEEEMNEVDKFLEE